MLALFAGVVVLGLAGCVAFLFHDTIELKSQTASFQQTLSSQQAGQLSFSPASSCAAQPPSSPSGYYWVRASDGSAVSVYCNMTLSCGGVTGGWMRVAELDMTNSNHQCPSGLMERNDSPNIRTCVRDEASRGCTSVELYMSTANIQFSSVCGRITAYQVGRVDYFHLNNNDLDDVYVDGVSLTHGSPRQHIWTFAAAGGRRAICDRCRDEPRPDSVGNDFFCDTGNPGSSGASVPGIFYGDNPLWDGDGCTADNECCPTDNPPYFFKTLPQSTTDNIEMRVCRSANVNDEDIAIEIVEMYVQ